MYVNDNIFGSAVFAVIAAIAIGAATAIVETEVDLARSPAQVAAVSAAAAQAATPLVVELPPVTVVGHRKQLLDEDAGVAYARALVAPTVY
jgi:hypothetical protein